MSLMLDRQGRRAPPRVDESKLSQPLQDLFATWRRSLQDAFKGLTADGDVQAGLFPRRTTGVSTQPLRESVDEFLASLSAE
ncbi:MAG: hypothetical protein WBD71_06585, partial [Xanthobacteraceae bacterium]